MRTALGRFLQFLEAERNAAPLTIKSYREDLTSLIDFLSDDEGACPAPAEVTPLDVRQYVAALHEAGYAKSSVSRRLASLRSFYRFAQREGLVTDNPAKPIRNPRPDRKLPHFLTDRRDLQAAGGAAARRTAGSSRPSDSGDDLLGRTASERTGGNQ